MTVIAAISDSTTVWMAGDSAAISGSDRAVITEAKVWRAGPWLFGLSGSPRASQLLRYAFTPPGRTANVDRMAYMCTTFADALRQCLQAGGLAKKSDERESFDGSYFLAATEGRIFKVWSDYQVTERTDGYDAIGCAEDYTHRGRPR